MTKNDRKALGRGLSALVSPSTGNVGGAARQLADEPEEVLGSPTSIPVDRIFNNPNQPRRSFAEEDLQELSNSIQELGVLQPILVRQEGDRYEIIAGERRWRASQKAGLSQIPAIVKTFSDKEVLQVSLVENIQRQQLNPLEEALGYQRLVQEFDLTQDEVADLVGKNRASVANHLRLLKLPPEIKGMLENNEISFGHARAILMIRDPNAQLNLAKKAAAENLSVRALEGLVNRVGVLDGKAPHLERQASKHRSSSERFAEVLSVLREALGTRVTIDANGAGKGFLKIEYFSEEELDRIVERICR